MLLRLWWPGASSPRLREWHSHLHQSAGQSLYLWRSAPGVGSLAVPLSVCLHIWFHLVSSGFNLCAWSCLSRKPLNLFCFIFPPHWVPKASWWKMKHHKCESHDARQWWRVTEYIYSSNVLKYWHFRRKHWTSGNILYQSTHSLLTISLLACIFTLALTSYNKTLFCMITFYSYEVIN